MDGKNFQLFFFSIINLKGEVRSMKKTQLLLFATTLAVCLAIGGLQTTWAQGDEFTLEEVVVSAQKREEKVQDVPIAITVANREQIERQQINTIADMARISPALDFTDPNSGPSGAGIIRGIGTVSWQETTVGSVAIVIDDVPGGNLPNNNVFDIERVEVLRGPQGMLFGQSASAGVINMVTVAPDLTGVSGYVHVEYSDKGTLGSGFGQELFRGALNVPVTENSAFRVSALANTYRGIQKNLYYNKDNVDKNYAARLRYLYEPSDNLSINLIADYNDRDREGPNAFTMIYAVPGSSSEESAANGGFTPEEGNQDSYTSYTEAKPTYQIENYGLSAQIDYTVADHTLTSITAYRDQTRGPDFSSVFPYPEPFHLKIEAPEEYKEWDQFSQEVRITSPSGESFEYVAGLFYSTASSQTGGQGSNVWLYNPPFIPFPIGSFQVAYAETDGYFYGTQNDSMAGYGQLTYHLSEKASLFAGLRLTKQDVELKTESRADGTLGGLSDEDTNFSWRFGGQYRFNPEVMAYGSVTQGYKPMAVAQQTLDPESGNLVDVPAIIKAEEPLSFEVGVKASLLDNRVALDANVFHNTVDNYQGQLCRPTNTGAWECVSQNVSEVVSKGFEIDLIGRPVAGLNVTSGLIYVSAEYPDGYLDVDGTDIGGKQLKNVPEWKFVLSADYTYSLTDTLLAYFAADGVYKTKVQMYEPISTQETIFPAFWDLGAQIGIRSANNTWGVNLWGRNLLDKHEPHFMVFESDGEISAIYGNQSFRQVGITLDYRF